MTRDKNQWVFDHFAASSCDLTPVSVRHAAKVLYAPVIDDPEVTKHCASVLSATEMQRAERFAKQSDQVLFKQRRAFRRFCATLALGSSQPMSGIVFNETELGCPYLADVPACWFSFSSCRFGFIAAWSSSHGVGVDFEDQTRDLDFKELARQFFSVAEIETVEKAGNPAFFQFWNLKEAALKSIGQGLPYGLAAFEFDLDPDPRVMRAPPDYGGPERFSAHLIEGTESFAAMVIRNLS